MFKKIFVFGSNTQGKHGKGAALYAKQHYGAIYGQSKGLQGNSYAIITKDLSKGLRSIDLDYIKEQVDEFIEFANNSNKKFFVSAIACGLAGYRVSEIAPMFNNIPDNVELCDDFKWYLNG